MLSITQFPRRFPTASKRTLHTTTGAAATAARALYVERTAPPAPATAPRALAAMSPLVGRHRISHSLHPRGARFVQTTAAASTPTSTTTPSTGKPRSPKGSQTGASQSFATAASALEADDDDEDEDDSYLFGERSDDWFTTSRNPRTDASFPGRCAATGTLSSIAMPNLATCSRTDMLDYLDNTWALTDALFASLQGSAAFTTPPPHQLRHPLIFYYGHPTVFYINKLVVAGLFDGPVDAHFEHVFEVGVDEMRWDDMSKNEMVWPAVADVTAYRRAVYAKVRALIQTHVGLDDHHAPIDDTNELWALCMALEHERIHLETSSMLMLEHPAAFFRKSELLPPYHASATRDAPTKRPIAGVDFPHNELLDVAGESVHIGKPRTFPTFGWDNEYGALELDVPTCQASQFLVSNGEFYAFVSSGGYLDPTFWSDLGWEWRCFRNTKAPQFWVMDGPSGSHHYKLRALFDVVSMQWDWPVQVNLHEAQAFCKWKNAIDQNAEDVVYHVTTEPIHQLLRNDTDKSADTTTDAILTLDRTQRSMADAMGKNVNVSYLSFSPVDAMAPSAKGFYDVIGNAWEWCEDKFAALPGFALHKYYDDFSAPCFDAAHNVIMGGSFMSSGDNGASKFARFHFRPHFFQHASFRVVAQPIDKATGTISMVTTELQSPGPFVNANEFRTSDRVVVRTGADTKTAAVDAVEFDQLFTELHGRTERVLETFMQRVSRDGQANTLLVRSGVDGAARLKEQVKPGHTMVVLSQDAQDATAVATMLTSDFKLVEQASMPVVVKESDRECRITMHTATAWTKQ